MNPALLPPPNPQGDRYWGLPAFSPRSTSTAPTEPPDPADPEALLARSSSSSGAGPDPALVAKLSTFHALKAREDGRATHFNASLAANRAFNNPLIYAKLVQFVELDECASLFPAMTSSPASSSSAAAASRASTASSNSSKPRRAAWEPQNRHVLQQGAAERLAWLQKEAMEEKQRAQTLAGPMARSRIDFQPGIK